jgi:hypothetical protein
MKTIKKYLIILAAIAMGLFAITGCGTAEPYTTTSTENNIIEETEASLQEDAKETETETEEAKKEIVSIVIYNPKSNFTVSSEDKESKLDITNNQLTNGIASNLFYIGTTYTMNIEDGFDTITFIGDTEQGKDTKYSIKNTFTTISAIAGNANKTTLSLSNRKAIIEDVDGEIKYEVVDIQESGKAYILDIQIKASENSTVTITYNEVENHYTIKSTNTITEINATYTGFSETEGTGAVVMEEGTTFVVSIDDSNMVSVDKTK